MTARHRPTEAERRAAGEVGVFLRVKLPVLEALKRLCAESGDSQAGLVSRLILEEEERELGG